MLKKIISGGQTGADRAALDVAIELGIPHGGWVPKGRKTENGRLPETYRMREISSISYSWRTEMNVVDSDGTLIISHGKLTGGSALTRTLAGKHRKPCLHIDLDSMDAPKAAEIVRLWIETRGIETLNVAGPRASKDPEIYEAAKSFLVAVIVKTLPRTVDEAVDRLISELPLKSRIAIANMPEEELSCLHPTVGEYIRRRFGLWSGNRALMESCDGAVHTRGLQVDDASGIIILAFWKKLKETHVLRTVK
ncbi:MAG: putative molybdenum carrier protein [Deltaproteobacteria bacterium]|nr:putative molybdenum carrier protein [Deltaproteobacteria bacterium]